MANFNYYLKSKELKKESPIRLHITYNSKECKLYTGLKSNGKNWNSRTQEVKNSVIQSTEKNKRLRRFKQQAESVYLQLVNEKIEITNSLLKEKIKESIEPKKTYDFFEYFEEHIDNNKQLAKSTLSDYNQTLQTVKNFEKETKYRVTFESINLEFYSDFQHYILDIKEDALNTFSKRIKTIKTIMRAALDRDYHNNLKYQHRDFKTTPVVYKNMYLNTTDLQMLINVKLSDSKLEKSRDLFILQCFFGIRIGDLVQIDKNSIVKNHDNYLFHYKSSKTNEFVLIPVHPIALNIIKKYNYNLPSERKININKHIKIISKIAGLDDDFSNLKGTNKKYEIIESRTGRRTFATNAVLNSNMPIRSIMAITGHKKESSFNVYVQAKRAPTHEEVYSIYGDL